MLHYSPSIFFSPCQCDLHLYLLLPVCIPQHLFPALVWLKGSWSSPPLFSSTLPTLMSSDKCKGVLVNHHMVYKLNKRGLPASARRVGRTSKLLTKLGGPQRRNFDDVINRGEDKVPSQQKITGPPPHPQPEIQDPPAFAANYPPPMVRKRDGRRDAAWKNTLITVTVKRVLVTHVADPKLPTELN